ncbi:acetate--CoA ligase family protein [Phytohabitans sp. ZYX-F-186]|uniref:Acetate--CoA ligase family protein n=1 Tax=Phytohabitans maris TaxID=3071409 RepID=A0ABU0ZNC7_9ACTN|nr:acetate--CoA ligase family protein [Phytohabitans sp. ZYX-F-186]MDQ7908551.1 acetate--CoA ligase family protein [Phytohabitans sp. ZYX-F-186]
MSLERLLKPSSVAFVGISDSSPFADFVAPTLDSDAEVFFVHPKHATAFGHPTVPRLRDIGRPVDAVMSGMAAARTTELAEEAADLDVGGLVLVAGGFAEVGPEGRALQDRLRAAARRGGMSVIGPNGLGYVNVRRGISLTIASRHKRRPGGISVVSQSGAMLSGVAMAAWDNRGLGLNVIVSAGNEAVTDLADYVEYFVDDPDTTAIGLVVEQVRRPREFFAAVRRAHAAGKPVVVLKLGRSDRTRRLAASHTAALAGDAWVYDVALRQAGVALAYDPEELVDRLQFFDQIPAERWSTVDGLAVLSMTGGFASLAYDVAAQEGLGIPALEGLGDWVRSSIPGVTVPNPLDATGFGGAIWDQIVDRYTRSPDVDSVLYVHPLADEDAGSGGSLVGVLAAAAADDTKPYVLVNCSGTPAEWTDAHRGAIALGHGIRGSMRGLATMGAFVRHRARAAAAPAAVPEVARPRVPLVEVPEGRMLPFAAAMELLRGAGIPVAPYYLVPEDAATAEVPFAGPYVVKLADVGHRTEHGAVRLHVEPADLPAAVKELREIADGHGLSPLTAVQPMVAGAGEAFIGIQGAGELGPLVVFGLGGVLVEALGRVGGRMAPFTRDDARELIDEFAPVKVMHGFRGQPPWDLDALAGILVAAGRLAAGGAGWLASLDINPLIWSADGFVAVDALCLVS